MRKFATFLHSSRRGNGVLLLLSFFVFLWTLYSLASFPQGPAMQSASVLTAQAGGTHIAFITDGIPGCDFRTGKLEAKCVPNFLAHAIKLIFGVSGAVCVILIIASGYMIILGNLPGGSTESGKNTLTWAIIGFIVSALSFFIMDFIISSIAGI